MQVTFERDGDGANFDLEPDKYHVLGFLGGSAECEVTLMEPLPGTFADCSDDYDEEASSKLPCDEDLARIESAVNSLDYGVLADSYKGGSKSPFKLYFQVSVVQIFGYSIRCFFIVNRE